MNAEDPLIGQVVSGRYKVLRPLGEGGMGQVYLALHEAIEKQIALKVLRPEYSAKEDIVTRFQQEAISASRIKHPNVLEVFDFGTLDNGCAYLAMEYLAGNDLADELCENGYLETHRAMRLMLQVCKALAAAHKAGVVHRDMKPDNIFLLKSDDSDEMVKIVDFGIAQLRSSNEEEAKSQRPRRRLTKTGMIFGTPEYMAPEQAAGKKADQRVDIYACGIILFEMLTGAVPFTGDSFMAVLAAHLNDPAPGMLMYRPDLMVSQDLHQVVAKALEKSADARYQSMGEFMAALLATPEGAQHSHLREFQPISHLPPPPSNAPSGPPGSLGVLTTPNAGPTAAQFSAAVAGSSNPTTAVPVQTGAPHRPTPARSHTLDASTSSAESARTSSGTVGMVFGGLALLIAGGVAAFVVIPQLQDRPSEEPVAAIPSAAPQPVVTRAVEVQPVPTTAPPTVAVATEPPKVVLSVETKPPGALLKMDDAQVCQTTPCEIRVEPGEAVELSARLGNRAGRMKVNPQNDQTVTIALRAPKKPAPKPVEKMCEVKNELGLKILRPCK